MCGIGGFAPARPDSGATVQRFLEAMAPRGPDDQGWACFSPRDGRLKLGRAPPTVPLEGVVLLHRRLAILDLSDAGHQPMVSPDGRYVLVFNGEIYNHMALRAELEALGRRFRSHTDSEVVLHALAQWGRDATARFEGMFAFAFMDTSERCLLLGRDPFGIKPLFYTHQDGAFAFASDLPSLFTVPWARREADLEQVTRFLTGHLGEVPADQTLFAGIRRVPPGHTLTFDLAGHVSLPEPFVSLWPDPVQDVPYEEAVAEVRRRFLANVESHLMADVPVGAALSGGIDSSAIVCAMRHVLGPDAPLHTFCYVPHDPRLSEERYMDEVVAHVGAVVHKVRPEADELVQDAEALIRAHGEPIGSPSVYAQYRVFRAARENGVPVVLDGQGADELLAGYRQFDAARLSGLVARGRLWAAWELARALSRRHGTKPSRLAREVAGAFLPTPVHRALKRLGIGRKDPAWLRTGWLAAQGALPPTSSEPLARDALRLRLYRTLVQTSLPDLLRYEDRNSMAHSVESRVPFLTVDLARYLLSLPEDYLLGPDGSSKRVFRDAMRGLVPDAVLDRHDKIGFVTTEAEWLRVAGPWVHRLLDTSERRAIPLFDMPALWALWHRLSAGDDAAARPLWRALSVIQWADVMNVHFPGAGLPDALPSAVPAPDPSPMDAGLVGDALSPDTAAASRPANEIK